MVDAHFDTPYYKIMQRVENIEEPLGKNMVLALLPVIQGRHAAIGRHKRREHGADAGGKLESGDFAKRI